MRAPRPALPPSLRPDEAVPTLAAIFVVFHLGVWLLSPLAGTWAVAMAQWLFIALPVLVLVRLRGLSPVEALRLDPPPAHVWAPVTLLSLGVIGGAALYMALQAAALSGFEWYRHQMERFSEVLDAATLGHLLGLLVSIALTAAVCEELLFRGHLLRSLEPALPRAPLCLVSGLLFGLFHANLLQLVPAVAIGAVLAWVALATQSLWPAVLMHFLFNAATLLSRSLIARGAVGEDSPVMAGVAVALAVIGLPLGALWLRRLDAGPPSSISGPRLTTHPQGDTP